MRHASRLFCDDVSMRFVACPSLLRLRVDGYLVCCAAFTRSGPSRQSYMVVVCVTVSRYRITRPGSTICSTVGACSTQGTGATGVQTKPKRALVPPPRIACRQIYYGRRTDPRGKEATKRWASRGAVAESYPRRGALHSKY